MVFELSDNFNIGRTVDSPANPYIYGQLAKDGFLTTRTQPAVDLYYHYTPSETFPRYRARDGSQIGPHFLNPNSPYHRMEAERPYKAERGSNSDTNWHTSMPAKHQSPGERRYKPGDLHEVLSKNPSYQNGGFYPFGSGVDYYRGEVVRYFPDTNYRVPSNNGSKFEVKPDVVKKYYHNLR